MLKKIEEIAKFVNEKVDFEPEIGIVLGTGLGGLVNEIDIKATIAYSDIPHFPVSTVEGHQGQLIFGKLGGKNVVAMQGRFHYYEGYSMQEVGFPIRVLKFLGIKLLILSNASGGVNPNFRIGDLMIIKDHINLMGNNPLIGKNDTGMGPRFPDMSEPYDEKMIRFAEYKYIRILGADAVGMSTVPEAIVARHMELPCFAISVISDLGIEGKIVEISHQEVIDAASMAEPKMTELMKEMIERLDLTRFNK